MSIKMKDVNINIYIYINRKYLLQNQSNIDWYYFLMTYIWSSLQNPNTFIDFIINMTTCVLLLYSHTYFMTKCDSEPLSALITFRLPSFITKVSVCMKIHFCSGYVRSIASRVYFCWFLIVLKWIERISNLFFFWTIGIKFTKEC